LRSFSTRLIAQGASRSDGLMHSHGNWCAPSRVICFSDYISNFVYDNSGSCKISCERTYYTIAPAPTYFIPATVGLSKWSASPIADKIIIVTLMKYIFGISNRTAHNIGVYVSSGVLQVYSFDHSPPLTEVDGPIYGIEQSDRIERIDKIEAYLLNPKKFIRGREFFKQLKVDEAYTTRLSEVFTACNLYVD
jgi:hypothetical protein